MKKDQAIQFFGGSNAMARAVGVTKSTVSEWPEIIPAKYATRIHFASGGKLDFCLEDYRPDQDETQQAA
ncbi:Cro/CI family transcriptional regulator [Aeromonas veronii]|uniref:transcriptional regulator n=1 Tax=Aeromonas veronii TaxID=654 RepID=UPI00214EA6A6|nr:Cro/CI family transcriptional regulator [Aeromonas veronii]MCR3957552.1 Cro/CI family transcriptional regulator [Aeromonas veronii]